MSEGRTRGKRNKTGAKKSKYQVHVMVNGEVLGQSLVAHGRVDGKVAVHCLVNGDHIDLEKEIYVNMHEIGKLKPIRENGNSATNDRILQLEHLMIANGQPRRRAYQHMAVLQWADTYGISLQDGESMQKLNSFVACINSDYALPRHASLIQSVREAIRPSYYDKLPLKMRACVVCPENGANVQKVDVPSPKDGEALIQILRFGICATDKQILQGYKGCTFSGILGHEFVGRVVQVRNEEHAGIFMHQRVVGDINIGCNECDYCNEHQNGKHCKKRTCLGIMGKDGAYAEYITLPVKNLVIVPENMTDEVATLAEPVAAALRILDQMELDSSRRVGILGDGKLGLLIAHVLGSCDASVSIIGKHEWKLHHAPSSVTAIQLTPELNLQQAFDFTIDSTGSASGINQAAVMTKHNGTIVLKTTTAEATNLPVDLIASKQLRIIGSRCGNLQQAISFLQQNPEIRRIVTHTFSFGRLSNALTCAFEGSENAIRVQVVVKR